MDEHVQTNTVRSVDGTILTYQVTGAGSLDVAFRGAGIPFELALDDPGFARFIKRMGSFCRLITPEPRGFGASGGYGPDAYDGTLADADLCSVLDAAGSTQAALVGWSATGGIMAHFAVTHPERVTALVLIDSCAHYVREDDYPWGFPREQLDDITSFLEGAWKESSDLNVTAPSRTQDERFRAWWGRARRSTYVPSAYAEVFRASLEADVRALLPSISVPTLVVHREGDRFIHLGAGRYLAEHIPRAKLVVLPGDDHLYFSGDTDALVDEIEEFLTGDRRTSTADRVLATVLFTDIVRSTERAADLGDKKWRELLDDHDRMVRRQLERFSGREIDKAGDGFFATFAGPSRAVDCAHAIRDALQSIGLEVRAGIHSGEVEVRGNEVAGMAVHIGARVAALAKEGEILVSGAVPPLVAGSSLQFEYRGEHQLKGVPGFWKVFAVET